MRSQEGYTGARPASGDIWWGRPRRATWQGGGNIHPQEPNDCPLKREPWPLMVHELHVLMQGAVGLPSLTRPVPLPPLSQPGLLAFIPRALTFLRISPGRVLGQLAGSLLEVGCSGLTIEASSLSGGQGLSLSKTSSVHLAHFSQILLVRSLA